MAKVMERDTPRYKAFANYLDALLNEIGDELPDHEESLDNCAKVVEHFTEDLVLYVGHCATEIESEGLEGPQWENMKGC